MKDTIRIAAIHSSTIYRLEEAEREGLSDLGRARLLKQKNVEKMFGFLHEAGRQGADIAVTHECFDNVSVGSFPEGREESMSLIDEVPGPISDGVAEIAARYDMNIAANYSEKEDGRVYNTSVLIDRRGRIIGKYRKIHLATAEWWNNTAGDEFTVLESDIGRIGFATCYDIQFPEHCRAVALNGADIILHQTQGWGIVSHDVGESIVRARAADNCVYLVVAKNIQKVNAKHGKSCIIGNDGNILAEAGGEEEKVVTADIKPDFDFIQKDFYNSLFAGIDSTRARMLLERRPSLYKILAEGNSPLRERYKGLRLKRNSDEIREIKKKLEKYSEDLKNNRPVERNYHW